MLNQPKNPISEQSFQRLLFWKFQSASRLLVPNYAPPKWWECDLFRILKSGYTAEYEIKISVADFKKDALKEQQIGRSRWPIHTQNKHQLLTEGSEQAPNSFSFVVPEKIVDKIEIPEWAGLIVGTSWQEGIGRLDVVKKAPKLHKIKSDRDWESELTNTFYWRFWNLKNKK